ncbi:MAG: hypothetical protein KAT46_05865, partial [Deltaproteobacteria bacterium]|nr:hypothetical protein [Deltaproteobacteria bacterium]
MAERKMGGLRHIKMNKSFLHITKVGVLVAIFFAFILIMQRPASAEECFESRDGGATSVDSFEIRSGWPNVKCSEETGGVLWWGDPFDGTIPMGKMPDNAESTDNKIEADYFYEEALVKPRIDKLMFYPCNNCHGTMVRIPKDNNPRTLKSPMYPHEGYAPREPKDLKHGKGAIWCLDCHDRKNRNNLVSHRGEAISFNQPQKLCGKCHGQILRDWRDGIHGKRIGSWKKGGTKRWWTCTECHNPHDVQPGFKALVPELAPMLPKGMKNADHERHHGSDHGDGIHGESSSLDHGTATSTEHLGDSHGEVITEEVVPAPVKKKVTPKPKTVKKPKAKIKPKAKAKPKAKPVVKKSPKPKAETPKAKAPAESTPAP